MFKTSEVGYIFVWSKLWLGGNWIYSLCLRVKITRRYMRLKVSHSAEFLEILLWRRSLFSDFEENSSEVKFRDSPFIVSIFGKLVLYLPCICCVNERRNSLRGEIKKIFFFSFFFVIKRLTPGWTRDVENSSWNLLKTHWPPSLFVL